MTTGFLKRYIQTVSVLIAALCLPALIFPFHHFHPESSQTLPGQLTVIGHQAHFHSEVLEAYVHLFNAHPSDPQLDGPFHQTHTSSGHENDDADSFAFQKNVIPAKISFVVKHFDISVPFEIPLSVFSRLGVFELLTVIPLNIFGPPSSRSPPVFLI